MNKTRKIEKFQNLNKTSKKGILKFKRNSIKLIV